MLNIPQSNILRSAFTYKATNQTYLRLEPFWNGFLIRIPNSESNPYKIELPKCANHVNARSNYHCACAIYPQTQQKNIKIGMICRWDIILLLFRIRMSQIARLSICCCFCPFVCCGRCIFLLLVSVGATSMSFFVCVFIRRRALAIWNYCGVIEFNASILDTIWWLRIEKEIIFVVVVVVKMSAPLEREILNVWGILVPQQ